MFESYRVASIHREVVLLLPDGRRQAVNDGHELTREQDGSFSALYRFRDLPRDWRSGALLCEVPTAILRRTVTWSVEADGPR